MKTPSREFTFSKSTSSVPRSTLVKLTAYSAPEPSDTYMFPMGMSAPSVYTWRKTDSSEVSMTVKVCEGVSVGSRDFSKLRKPWSTVAT